jgi:hypothetical protein
MDTDHVETTSTETAAPVTPLSPFPKRVLEVFISPGRLMDGLAAKPAWGAAMILGLVLLMLPVLLIPPEIWLTMVREQMIARGQDPSRLPATGASVFRIGALISVPIVYLVSTMIFAGLITLLFSFIMGDEGRFKQYLASLTHAMLIPAIIGLALVPLRIAQADPRLTLNVGTFLFFLPEGYLLRWATMMDLSMLWAWLVVAQGAHAFDRKRSFSSAAVTVLVVFVVTTALFALLPGAG